MAVAYRSHVAAFHYEAAGTVTITKPTGTAEGDVLLAALVNNDGTRTLDTLPSGWTALDVSGTSTTPSTRQWVDRKSVV